jgi:hypothetical protein
MEKLGNLGELWNSISHLALMWVESFMETRDAYSSHFGCSAFLSLPASGAEVCDRNCVGPLCGENCTRTPDVTVGKSVREPDVTIEERRRVREPDVEIRRERRPGVDVEINR